MNYVNWISSDWTLTHDAVGAHFCLRATVAKLNDAHGKPHYVALLAPNDEEIQHAVRRLRMPKKFDATYFQSVKVYENVSK